MATGQPDVWRICVDVPQGLRPEQYTQLFDAVADAAHDWEPEYRDGWDLNVYAGPSSQEFGTDPHQP